jgi:hypothetical protein
MNPTVGRIVHFYGAERPVPQAAIITKLHETDERVVDLVIFAGDYGAHAMKGVPGGDADTFKPGGALPCWVWPPRE